MSANKSAPNGVYICEDDARAILNIARVAENESLLDHGIQPVVARIATAWPHLIDSSTKAVLGYMLPDADH